MFTIHVSQPKAVGSNLLDQFRVEELSQTATDKSGWKSATIPVTYESEEYAEDWLKRLMAHVDVYSPYGAKIGEWFVNRVIVTEGALTTEIGPVIDAVANDLTLLYTDIDTDEEATATATDSTSIALYGTLEGTIDSGEPISATVAAQQVAAKLAETAYPRLDRRNNGNPQSGNQIQIEVIGYESILSTYHYESATAGNSNLSTKLIAVLAAQPDSLFSSITTNITSNSTQVPTANDRATARSIIDSLLAASDSGNDVWLFGIYNGRIATYAQKPAESSVSYLTRTDSNIVTGLDGQPVELWDIRPGRWLEYTNKRQRCYLSQVTFAAPDKFTFAGGNSRTAVDLIQRRFDLPQQTGRRVQTLERKSTAAASSGVSDMLQIVLNSQVFS